MGTDGSGMATCIARQHYADGTGSAPPTFAGVGTAVADTPYSMRLTWTEASDGMSDPAQIEYRVFVSPQQPVQQFTEPASFIVGTSGGVVGGLMPETPYYVTVRAVNERGVMDTNTIEKMVTTPLGANPISLSTDVLPILRGSCTDVGVCHGTARTNGMELDTALLIQQTAVSACAMEEAELPRIHPGDSGRSYLIRKILGELTPVASDGVKMPPAGMFFPDPTPEQITTIREWIDQGANN